MNQPLDESIELFDGVFPGIQSVERKIQRLSIMRSEEEEADFLSVVPLFPKIFNGQYIIEGPRHFLR